MEHQVQLTDLVWVLIGLGGLNVILLLWLLYRKNDLHTLQKMEELEEAVFSALHQHHDEFKQFAQKNSREDRDELGQSIWRLQQLISGHQTETLRRQNASFETLLKQLATGQEKLGQTLQEQFGHTVEMNTKRMQEVRSTLDHQLSLLRESGELASKEQGEYQTKLSSFLNAQLKEVNEINLRRMGEMRQTLDTQLLQISQMVSGHLQKLQANNDAKLEEMRQTVDEKLHDSLEKRLGESFKQVAERLEQVHRGLGEMQQLAQGVGDLKGILSNVKSKGVFGEIQLELLLEQVLVAEQYQRQVKVHPQRSDLVDFAIALPKQQIDGAPCWLPIDAKFPTQDYERLLDAQQRNDAEGAEMAAKALENRIRQEAKSVSEKYISPPYTTDFAIIFLPAEGLYAEVLRRPGLIEALQQQYHIIITGPTTILALLNSLQMGFRTLALEKRSAEVWRVLGTVKTEFIKFGDVLSRMRSQLQSVTNTIDSAQTRTRVMHKALKDVEQLPITSVDEEDPLPLTKEE